MKIQRYAIPTGRFSVAELDDAREDAECGAWVTFETAELLCKQLAARDAALDAVLRVAQDWQTIPSTYPITAPSRKIIELLAAHGVHPK